MEGVLNSLNTYPVKSLGGISATTLEAKKTGMQFDRNWMLVDEANLFITQRKYPQMAMFKLSFAESGFNINYKGETVLLPFIPEGETTNVEVWGDSVQGTEVSEQISGWISDRIGSNVKLVKNMQLRMVENSEDHIPFSDSSPYLLIGTSSLDLLNSKLESPVKIDRFRPNLVVEGFDPHEEDTWERIKIGECVFRVLKPCPRCKIPNVNQETGVVDRQIIPVLNQYRKTENGTVNFGVHLILENGSTLEVGNTLSVLS